MFIEVFLDVSISGGAFMWPSRGGEAPPVPHFVDYLVISLNVSTTYRRTNKALVSALQNW
jgi:hypothetical protein